MAAAIVNRRKFRWYDWCFPQSDDHGNEKGANGMHCGIRKEERRKGEEGGIRKDAVILYCSIHTLTQ